MTSTEARTSSENVTSRFCNHFSIIQSHYACKMYFNYLGIKLEPALGTKENKIEHLSSFAHVVHATAKQVISLRGKNENVFKMSKDENCTCKACKKTVFHGQICKFVGVLLPSSSWLLMLPNNYFQRTSVKTISGRSYCQKCHIRFILMFTSAWIFSCNYSMDMLSKVDFRNRHKQVQVSSSQSLSGGLFDLTNQTIEKNKINWTFLSKNIRLYYHILEHLCLNEQLKYIETWLRKKKTHSCLFTRRFMDTSSIEWPRIEQETSIALLTASCLTLVSFESSKEEKK